MSAELHQLFLLPHVADEFRALLADRFQTTDDVRNQHGHDVSHHGCIPPEAVLFPETIAEVADIAKLCFANRLPLIPFGTGTAVEGGVVATQGGVSLDLSRINRINRISIPDRDCTVEAGVTRQQLNRRLEALSAGLYFPVDPGADASLGGMAATSASGSAAVHYGTMRENVLGLTVVLADGRIIKTGGRARKSSAGYDLTRMFVGSEGTLGIIVEVTLKLAHLPPAVAAAVCPFETIEDAVAAVIDCFSAGLPLARIELLDEIQMAAVNRYSGLACRETPTLFFEFHGTEHGVAEQSLQAGDIVHRHRGGDFQWATDKAARDRLWQARHDAYYASVALRSGGSGYVTDVCVPISQLAESIRRTRELLKRTQIPAPLFGHVGDGNFHVVFSIDPHSAAELNEVRELSREIIEIALELGGTCTGEHGIGIGKLDALEREHGAAVDVMRSIKAALDPRGILNPGKVLRSPSTPAH